jgi:hypothetical protein
MIFGILSPWFALDTIFCSAGFLAAFSPWVGIGLLPAGGTKLEKSG